MPTPAVTPSTFKIYYLNEGAVTLEFGQIINPDLLQQITGFNRLIHQSPFPGLKCTVPAYSTLSVFYDPVQVINAAVLPGADGFEKVCHYLNGLMRKGPVIPIHTGETVSIPVCYGGDFGPDLDEVCKLHQLSIQEVIRLHTEAVYTVYMIGFVPGFAYLGGMNVDLESPRKPVPRKAVPAGAVGIAGKQTGVYPVETPGGWQLIGRTPAKLFDVSCAEPALLKAGDQVVFRAITRREFEQYSS